MPTRRLHTKSRNGCQTCKKRRVKCDEQGPPCTNCAAKNMPCSYVKAHEELIRSDDDATASSAWTGRQLELELMHRWSTSTYRSLCTIPQDEHLLQVLVPRDALNHGYLMDGIFALAALDLALSTATPGSDERDSYTHAAMQYFDRALGAYSAELANLAAENHQAVFMFSSLLTVLHLTLLQCPPPGEPGPRRVFTALTALFELLAGTGSIALVSWEWLEAGPIPVRDVLEHNVPASILDEDTKAAIGRLFTLNDSVHSGTDTGIHAAYKGAISYLEEFFAKEADGAVKASWFAWPGMVEPEFTSAVQRSDPLALVIFMHWGVIVDGFGTHRESWWVGKAGRDLVAELSDELMPWARALMSEWRDAISWARQKVNLSPLG